MEGLGCFWSTGQWRSKKISVGCVLGAPPRETCSHLKTELRSAATLKWSWIFYCRWLSATSWNRGSCANDILWESGKRIGEVFQGWGGSQNRVQRSGKVWFQQGVVYAVSLSCTVSEELASVFWEGNIQDFYFSTVLNKAGRSSGAKAVLRD